MEVILLILAIVLPSIGWIAVCYWWDRNDPEPPRLITKLFFSGMALGFVITLILIIAQILLVSFGSVIPFGALIDRDGMGTIVLASLISATAYETLILWLARKIVVHEKAFDQIVDGIIFFSTIAIGAALVENTIYIFSSQHLFSDLPQNILPLIFRMVFSSILSAVTAGIVGFGIGNAYKQEYRGNMVRESSLQVSWKHPEIIEALTVAIFIHTCYRIFVYIKEPRIAGFMAIIGAFYLFTRFAYRPLTSKIHD